MNIVLALNNDREGNRIREKLRRLFPDAGLRNVTGKKEWENARREKRFDAVLTAEHLTWSSGLQIFKQAREVRPDVPVIMITARRSLKTAVKGLRLGLTDYLTPGEMDRVPDLLKHSLPKEYSTEIQQSAFRYANDAILVLDGDTIIDCNVRTEEIFGCRTDDILRRKPYEFSPPRQPDGRDSREKALEYIHAALAGTPQRFRWQHIRLDGTPFETEVSLNRFEAGERTYILAIVQDVSERRNAQKQVNLLSNALRSVNESINITDIDGNILYVNPAFEEMYGYSAGEICGKTIDLLWSDRNPSELTAQIRPSTLKGGWQGELWNRRRDGSEFLIELRTSVVRNEQNEPIALIAVATDITERKRAEKTLRESETRFRSIVENSHEGIVLVDDAFRFIYVNEKFTEICGYPAEQLLMQDFRMVLDDQSRDLVVERYRRRQRGEEVPAEYEFNMLRKDGNIRRVEIRSTLLKDSDGKVQTLAQILDITERRKMEEALNTEREQFLSIFDSMDSLIYVADPRTYEILFVNKALKQLFGEKLVGKICYREFQNLDQPCDFCTNHIILKQKPRPYQWEFHNSKIDKDFSIIDRIIRWPDGREVRLEIARDITARKQMEDALRESEEKFRSLVASIPDAVIMTDASGRITFWNQAAEKMFGYPQDKILGQQIQKLLLPGDRDSLAEGLLHFRETGQEPVVNRTMEAEMLTKSGRIIPVEFSVTALNFRNEWYAIGLVHNLSGRKSLEAQLLQAQKMEAVGKLAGGVAHDFNNLLTVINGYCDILLSRLRPGQPFYREIDQIRKAGERAASLTSQLLAFSRKQIIQPEILNLNQVIAQTEKMLRRLIGEDVLLRPEYDSHPVYVKMDPAQIDQIIMNLAVNARDAMPGGGQLVIRTGTRNVDHLFVRQHPGCQPGKYAVLTVSDTGVGMEKEMQKHIFEPFFTTKGKGKGTGLGLSTVYGIVQQNNGCIEVESEPGRGATFSIYIPLYEGKLPEKNQPSGNEAWLSGRETILLVEDETHVRDLAKRVLEEKGYRVLEAADGREGLALIEKNNHDIRLLITDVIMPRMGGKELAEQVKRLYPGLKVLFMSGYTDDTLTQQGVLDAEIAFIQKPFSPREMLKKVRALLEAPD